MKIICKLILCNICYTDLFLFSGKTVINRYQGYEKSAGIWKHQQGYVSYQIFYDQLSPYGQWSDYS